MCVKKECGLQLCEDLVLLYNVVMLIGACVYVFNFYYVYVDKFPKLKGQN